MTDSIENSVCKLGLRREVREKIGNDKKAVLKNYLKKNEKKYKVIKKI